MSIKKMKVTPKGKRDNKFKKDIVKYNTEISCDPKCCNCKGRILFKYLKAGVVVNCVSHYENSGYIKKIKPKIKIYRR
ncbi:MAG: hypothetical protein ACQEQF_07095 [Bacillota bacterium]